MSTMRLKYVQAWVDREGRAHHYFRRPGFPRVRLPGLPGSPEFNRAYEGALASAPEPVGAKKRSRPGSLSAAIATYYGSQQYRALRGGTPAKRRAILERFREQHGDKPILLLPHKFVVVMLSTMKPHEARNWLKAIRHLMQFCLEQEMVRQDPTQGVKLPKVKSDGHHTWTDEEIAQYEAHHPIGSKARLAFALLLYTAQRRGDVVRMGKQHIINGCIAVRQEKTGKPLMIPIRPELQAVLDATPSHHLTFLVSKGGRAYTPNDFSEQFRAWCDGVELHHCSAHGLRKAACRRMAEAGYTAHEIAAWSGHKTLKEVQRYCDAADQERMARTAMEREQIKAATVKPEQSEVSKPLQRLGKK
jgi:integrase